MKIIITNKDSAIYDKEYEVIYRDGNGYYIRVMGTLIFIHDKDCAVIVTGKQ